MRVIKTLPLRQFIMAHVRLKAQAAARRQAPRSAISRPASAAPGSRWQPPSARRQQYNYEPPYYDPQALLEARTCCWRFR